jgi:hypothetical protein
MRDDYHRVKAVVLIRLRGEARDDGLIYSLHGIFSEVFQMLLALLMRVLYELLGRNVLRFAKLLKFCKPTSFRIYVRTEGRLMGKLRILSLGSLKLLLLLIAFHSFLH